MGKTLDSEGLITHEDIKEARFGKESRIISIGLPAYCLLQALLRSIKANSPGILISKLSTSCSSSCFSFYSLSLFMQNTVDLVYETITFLN